jgi:hypothetical protein
MNTLNFIFKSIPLSLLGVLIKLAGLFVVPVALLFRKERTPPEGMPVQYDGWRYMKLPKLFSWWDNVKYGTMGNYAWDDERYNPFHEKPTSFLSQYYWLALRNPGNGLYGTSLFSCVQADNKISYKGQELIDNGKYGWQFVVAKGKRTYTGFYLYKPYTSQFCLELRIGFKILPTEEDRKRPVGCTFIINPFKGKV